jgi:DNA uptake protein ComE-like DNA-binding protein
LGSEEAMSIESLTEAERDAVLEVVNTASFGELDLDAELDKRAAEHIVAHRDGADASLGTADDDPFETLGELDAVPYVGPAAITKLVLYAESLGLLDDDELSPADVAAILAVANTASLSALDDVVGLDERAAENIVAHRVGPDETAGTGDDDPFETLEELDDVPYVGDSAIAKLLAYAEAQPPPSAAPCLIISEYFEGDELTDGLELFNCGTAPIDLTQIGVCLVRNDDTTCSVTDKLTPASGGLDGPLPAGDVWTLCRSQESVTWLPSINIAQNCKQVAPGIMNFSGDDRLLVFHDLDGDGSFNEESDASLDAFGVIDQRPPSQWWENMDLRRCNLEPFDGLNETEFYRWDYFTELGNGFTEHFGVPPTGGGCP